MSELSFYMGTIGLVLPFVVTEHGLPISNAQSATVTWLNNRGVQRHLTLTSPVSAEFCYTTSAGEFRTPHIEEGVLRVSFYTNVFYTSSFTTRITGLFE